MMARWMLAAFVAAMAFPVLADEKLAGKACRSVHLQYQAPEAEWFHSTIVVEKSAPGTYFCAGGFSQGYLGIQQLGNGKRLAIFSVWDPTSGDDPSKVDPAKRVKMLEKGPKTRVGRFGGEGTGGQSFIDDLPWKEGQEVRFLLRAKALPDEKRTAYSAWVALPDAPWQPIATFSTLSDGRLLKGYYGFVEDFKRDVASARQERVAYYRDTQVRDAKGKWQAVTKARFTADSNPSTAIDAGAGKRGMFLATGGATANSHVKLREWVELDAKPVEVVLPAMAKQ
ncbi:MAG: DUF3472 domain-containing protein [Planctomycetes bacterium]|nr:DUF3472 domain-containing protein [Planctomycetota bacterium]